MKKVLLIASAIGIGVGAFAQGKVTNANLNLDEFFSTMNFEYLERAKTDIDEAIINEDWKTKGKTWFVRQKVYQTLANDSAKQVKYPNASFESLAAFKKIGEVNDPKFKDTKEALAKLDKLTLTLSNNAYYAGLKNDNEAAAKYLLATDEIYNILKANGFSPVDSNYSKSLISAAYYADLAKNDGLKESIVTKLIASHTKEVRGYSILADMAYAKKDFGKVDEYVDKGLLIDPTNSNLILIKTNRYLSDSKPNEAIVYLEKLLVTDPENLNIIDNLAIAYENIGQPDKAKSLYDKLLAKDPNSFSANYGLGAMLVNKAKKVKEEMDKLGMSKAEQLKYDELDKQIKAYYTDALPYLSKAEKINSTYPGLSKTIKQLRNYLGL